MESTATDSGSATTGAASFSEAFANDASSASTPSPDSTAAASAGAATTEPPATSATTDGSTPASGEPPKERWADILENARTKARDEALAQWRQQHGWAEQVNPQEFQRIQDLARKASADPIAYLQDFIAELRSNPAYASQLNSLAARALSQARGQAQPDPEPQPDIPLQLEDGRIVKLYSDEAQAKREAWLQQRWLAQVRQELQPVVQTTEQLQKEREALAHQAEISQYVETTYKDASAWPGMDSEANRKAVAERLLQMRVNEDDPRDVSLALNQAWRDVVLPTLTQKAQAALLDDLKTKAAASSSVNPGSAAASSPRRVDSFYSKDLQW